MFIKEILIFIIYTKRLISEELQSKYKRYNNLSIGYHYNISKKL